MARRNHTLEERVQAVREYLEGGKIFLSFRKNMGRPPRWYAAG